VGATRHGGLFDIHIDELDPDLKSREQWISGVQKLLAEGDILLRTEYHGQYILAGCISLRSCSEAIGINFSDEADLEHELDVTPPSLYVFQRDCKPWAIHNRGFVDLGSSLRLTVLPTAAVMYLEYQEPTEVEFRRSLWIVPPDAIPPEWTQA
jgi:hypothetical protein